MLTDRLTSRSSERPLSPASFIHGCWAVVAQLCVGGTSALHAKAAVILRRSRFQNSDTPVIAMHRLVFFRRLTTSSDPDSSRSDFTYRILGLDSGRAADIVSRKRGEIFSYAIAAPVLQVSRSPNQSLERTTAESAFFYSRLLGGRRSALR